MSVTNNETVDLGTEATSDDLDAFSDMFFSKDTPEDPVNKDEDLEVEDEAALEDESEEDDTEVGPDDELSEDEEEEEEVPQKPVSRAEKRIRDLAAKNKEKEQLLAAKDAEVADLKARLSSLEDALTPKSKEPVPVKTSDPARPKSTDLNEDGSEKYPLGDYDPEFIADTVRYSVKAERAAEEAERIKQENIRLAEEVQTQLQTSWKEKSTSLQERYPDFQDKTQNLVKTFDNINEAYGEYLATTLMAMDHGPEVLYYLSSNPEEADKIIMSGPTKATIALGRIEAKFANTSNETKQSVKASKAPAPPPVNRGSSVGRTITPDTDDLDAFAKLLFSKK